MTDEERFPVGSYVRLVAVPREQSRYRQGQVGQVGRVTSHRLTYKKGLPRIFVGSFGHDGKRWGGFEAHHLEPATREDWEVQRCLMRLS